MSAPKTDLEKQKRQHKAPLLGMRAVVLWALVLLALLVVFYVVRGNAPDAEGTPVENATGTAPNQTEPAPAPTN